MSASVVNEVGMPPLHPGDGESAMEHETRTAGGVGAGDREATGRPMAGDVCRLAPAPLEKPRSRPAEQKTLAVDLGTHTGWALMTGDKIIDSGTELLASDEELEQQREEAKERTSDMRFGRILDFVEGKVAAGVDRIVFEDVIFAGSQAQTQLWSSLRTAIWLAGRDAKVSIHCVAVATLKRFATGNGGARKPDLARALAIAEPGRYQLEPRSGLLWRNGQAMDDNEVDAIWLARYTAAVDRGEASFVGPHQRKAAAKAQRRARRAAAKAEKKARVADRKIEERAKRRILLESIKAAGRCCGVLRQPMPFGRAICPKCGTAIRLARPIAPQPTPAARPDSLPQDAAGGSAQTTS